MFTVRGGHQIEANRAIVAARCAKLASIMAFSTHRFGSTRSRGCELHVKILWADKDTFTALLGFLYSDEFSAPPMLAPEVLILARKLNLPRLEALCIRILQTAPRVPAQQQTTSATFTRTGASPPPPPPPPPPRAATTHRNNRLQQSQPQPGACPGLPPDTVVSVPSSFTIPAPSLAADMGRMLAGVTPWPGDVEIRVHGHPEIPAILVHKVMYCFLDVSSPLVRLYICHG